MSDLNKTIHYTTNAEYICQGLLEYIPKEANLIEPFVGDGDLVKLFPNHKWETYDKQAGLGIQQDTLQNPPDYSNKWVITNPPYLAKNKAEEKEIFLKYKLDDHYKIFLHTCLMAEGGLVIIPLNFITDENSKGIRQEFLNRFEILKANLFTEPVFETTTYSVMAFVFRKKEQENEEMKLSAQILPEETETTYILRKEYNWRLAGDFFAKIDKVKPIFNRLTEDGVKGNVTLLKLYALDTRTVPIHISFGEEPYIGKKTDRVYLTFTTPEKISADNQRFLAMAFNHTMEVARKKYHNMIFTNYRDYNRKRISFTFAYKLLTLVYQEVIK